MSLELATENETPMKAKKQASEGTPMDNIAFIIFCKKKFEWRPY